MKKRLLSAILSLCMLLTMAPTVAFAAEKNRPEGATGITVAGGVEGTTKSDSVWYKIDTDTKPLLLVVRVKSLIMLLKILQPNCILIRLLGMSSEIRLRM